MISHGVTSPQNWAKLYNSTWAGIALSFTNVSLLATELLACGTVPCDQRPPLCQSRRPEQTRQLGAAHPFGDR